MQYDFRCIFINTVILHFVLRAGQGKGSEIARQVDGETKVREKNQKTYSIMNQKSN